ncbi:MAG TPA: GNAT family N-acetyltransferase, partial [Thermomicrobiales bacterium]|nr:GNAT family N-acetyltransferase [Thermomicrobiales bacterium]
MIAQQPDGHAAAPPAFRILPATPADIASLHGLVRALAEYERLSDICTSTEADLAAALFGPRPVAEALIARLDGNCHVAAGFALFFHTYSTFLGRPSLWLEDLFVRPEQRGAGIGQALIRTLAAIAADRGCGRFEWAVLDWNEPAIRFYESLGAAVLPDWRIARVTGDA